MLDESVLSLLRSFKDSTINCNGEFIAAKKGNPYFSLSTCRNDFEIRCKVLEWLSRDACKTQPFMKQKKNDKYNKQILDGINAFLGTAFTKDEMLLIYTRLGNCLDRSLTVEFIDSGFNLGILRTL